MGDNYELFPEHVHITCILGNARNLLKTTLFVKKNKDDCTDSLN